jgi:malonyl CoA-acyl carrier protein transacylase/NAD(P)-dependent dehydrogenase (short-subunit alcohol dehydrogenase family)
MIGHTKAAAGTAGLIKMALALRHQVLPSTLNVERPNPVLAAADSPFYVLGESRPWIARPDGQPRRAGVSAFGFGGTNFHAVLEEYRGAFAAADIESLRAHWPVELLVLSAGSRSELARAVEVIAAQLPEAAGLSLADLGLSLVERFDPRAPARLAIVAGGGTELRERLATAARWLGSDQGVPAGAAVQMIDPRGVFFGAGESLGDAPIAFLFPGQGSQYPSMLRDLALYFAQVRATFAEADAVLADVLDGRLTDRVFPPHAFTDADAEAQRAELTRTEIAQPAIGAASLAMLGLLESFGLAPAMVAGHSYGEYVALHRAGVIDRPTLLRLSELRGRCIVEAAGEDLGTMASVSAGADTVAALLEGNSEVRVANRNAPDLTVIAGTSAGVTAAIDVLERADLSVRRIPVACGFHSPCVAPASERLSAELARVQMHPPALPVYSNVTAARYPQQPAEVLALLSRHLVSPVNFVDQIGAMYEDGARLFVEVGPHGVLTKLVGRILGDRPHMALASDSPQRSGLVQLMHLLGQLAAAGVDLSLARLFANRNAKSIDINRLAEAAQGPAPSPSTWLVNGGYVRPRAEPRVSKRQPPPATLAAPVAATSAPEQPAVAPPAAPAPAAPPPVAAAGLPASSDQVMAQYLRLNNQFLETQTRVMLTYLQGRGHRAAAAPGATLSLEHPGVLASAAVATPAPQTPAVFADQAPGGQAPASTVAPASPPAPAEPPQPSSGLDEGALRTVLLELVGERTGYPPEMLDLDLNIEADLGIDSIKRTEILGAFRKRLFPDGGDATVRGVVEQAAQERTLRGIIDRFATLAGAATAPPAQPAQPSGALDAEALRTALLELVGERTGYPPEMLDLDLNVEADLGIDSIKRTEILGAFRKRLFPDGGDATVRAVVEQAVHERTLRGIIDRFATLGGAVQAPAAASSPAPGLLGGTAAVPAQAGPRTALPELPRFLIEPAPLPHSSVPFVCDRGAIYLVTDDEEGVAQRLVDRLREHGAEPILLRHGPAGAAGDGVRCLDLTDSHAVQGLRESLPAAAALAGIFHCLPLRPAPAFDELTLAQWLQTVRIGTKSLFNLAMVFDPELGGDRGCVVVAAVRLGGDLGIGNPGAGLRVDHAGPGGLLKTLVKEWPSAHCRCVDFGETATPVEIAERLLVEAVPDGGPVEIGYQAGRRLCFPARYAPLGGGTPQILLDAGSVILITGGARGITAEIAQELARLYRPKLILCGSSPLPDSEADDIRGITDARELKARLAERLRRSGAAVQLARIESEFRRIQKAREIRASLDACRAAGAEVEYRSVDVRDEAAFGGLIDALYERFGRIDGVVHGAGIVEDKRIGDKTGESFDRVVDTKVASGFVLSRRLRPETLAFLAFFTSVAGRFGNRGQSDYGAANEILSKLALELDRRWPSRVVALSWGPWDKTGMVSPEIKQQFARLGVVAVPPQLGREGFDRELRFGSKGDAEVVWGDGPWRDEAAVHTAACDPTPSETAAH